MKISSLMNSFFNRLIVIFILTSIGVSNVWSEVSPLCNPSLTNFTIDATAKYSYGKQIYFFTGSMVSVVDTTTNRVINSSKIRDTYDCSSYNRTIESVDVASDIEIDRFENFRFYKFGLSKLTLHYIQLNRCYSLSERPLSRNEPMTLDETNRINTTEDYFTLALDSSNALQLLVKYSNQTLFETRYVSYVYYLRTRIMDGRKEIAIVDKSDRSSAFNQLNGYYISSLLYLPSNMSNDLFKGEQIILFANRYLTYVSKKLGEWIPFRVKNFARELVCQTSTTDTTITTTPSSTTNIESPICKQSVTDLTIDSTAKHRDRKHIYFFTGEEITVVDTTRNRLNHSSKIADYFIGSTDDWHSADLAISDNVLVIYQFDQDNDKLMIISYDSLQIVDRNTSTPNSRWRSHLDLDFESDVYIHLIRKRDHLLIGFSKDLENSELYQLRLWSNHISLSNNFNDESEYLLQLNGHNITSLIVLPDYMSNGVFRSDEIILFANRFFAVLSIYPNTWTPFRVQNLAEIICQNSWITETTKLTETTFTSATTQPEFPSVTQHPTQTSKKLTKASDSTITSTTAEPTKRTKRTTNTITKTTDNEKNDRKQKGVRKDYISEILISIFVLLLLCVIAFIVWFVFIRDKPREEMQSIQQRPEYNATSGPPQVVSPNASNEYQSEVQPNTVPTNPSVEQTSPVMQPIQQSQEYNSDSSEAQPFQSNPTFEPQPQPQPQSFDA